jgi:hypothetical protein
MMGDRMMGDLFQGDGKLVFMGLAHSDG